MDNKIIEHGSLHISNNQDLYEIARSNNFELLITGIDTLVKPGTLDTIMKDNAQTLRLSLASCTVPSFTQNAITVQRGNGTVKYAGKPTFNNLNMVFNEYLGVDTLGILQAMQQKQYDVKTQSVGRAVDYKRDCYLIQYSPDWEIVKKWKLYNGWFTSISPSDFSNDSDDKKTVSATFEYDYFTVE